MAHHHQAVPVEMAPPAEVAVAVLKKINGTLPLIVPTGIGYFGDIVYDQERARVEDREHRPILRANNGIAFAAGFHTAQHVKRQGTPTGNDTAEEGSLSKVHTRIEA